MVPISLLQRYSTMFSKRTPSFPNFSPEASSCHWLVTFVHPLPALNITEELGQEIGLLRQVSFAANYVVLLGFDSSTELLH